MKAPLYKLYAETKPLGTYGLCNWGGLLVLDIKYGIEDYILACYAFGDRPRRNIRWHKIETSSSGRSFFRKNGTRYYLDEIMRVA